jgi:hypothetical protein
VPKITKYHEENYQVYYPALLLLCSIGQQTTKPEFSVVSGFKTDGIIENTDIALAQKQPDTFTGATKTGFMLVVRASQRLGAIEVESGTDFMTHRQIFTLNDLESGLYRPPAHCAKPAQCADNHWHTPAKSDAPKSRINDISRLSGSA